MKDRFHCINTLNINMHHSVHRPTGKPIHTWNQMHFGKIMYKAKYSPMPARTIYPHVASLCRRFGTWRPKTERPLHSHEQTNKQTNVPFTSLGGVCVCGRGPRVGWSTLAFYPKRPARPSCWRLIQTTALSLLPRPRLEAGSESPANLRRTSKLYTTTDLVVI